MAAPFFIEAIGLNGFVVRPLSARQSGTCFLPMLVVLVGGL